MTSQKPSNEAFPKNTTADYITVFTGLKEDVVKLATYNIPMFTRHLLDVAFIIMEMVSAHLNI